VRIYTFSRDSRSQFTDGGFVEALKVEVERRPRVYRLAGLEHSETQNAHCPKAILSSSGKKRLESGFGKVVVTREYL